MFSLFVLKEKPIVDLLLFFSVLKFGERPLLPLWFMFLIIYIQKIKRWFGSSLAYPSSPPIFTPKLCFSNSLSTEIRLKFDFVVNFLCSIPYKKRLFLYLFFQFFLGLWAYLWPNELHRTALAFSKTPRMRYPNDPTVQTHQGPIHCRRVRWSTYQLNSAV